MPPLFPAQVASYPELRMTPEPRELPDWLKPQATYTPNLRHGHAPASGCSVEYTAWKNMIQRCTNPANPRYADYGGRGIKIQASWFKFEPFLKDMGECPIGWTLDRRDNNLGYSKENCRWVDVNTQNRNQRLRRDNKTAIKGVYWQQNRWYASTRVNGKLHYLYSGHDFFEACCRRKSWEALHVR